MQSGGRWTDYLRWKDSQRGRPLSPSHGVWCGHCNFRHPYNGRNQLLITYTQALSGQWILCWGCPRTGFIIKELPL